MNKPSIFSYSTIDLQFNFFFKRKMAELHSGDEVYLRLLDEKLDELRPLRNPHLRIDWRDCGTH